MATEPAASSSRGSGAGAAIHRLVRTLSGKASTPISPILSAGTILPSVSENQEPPNVNTDVEASPNTTKDLLSLVIDRVKNLDFGFSKSGAGSDSRSPQETGNASNGAYTSATASTSVETQDEVDTPPTEPFPGGPADPTADPAADPDEQTYLARKIQALIDALPLPNSPRTPAPPKKPKPPARDQSGRPIPPPGATPIKDSKLIALLSSATIMNGGRAGERERKVSVWSVLESLGSQRQDDGNGIENGGDGEGEGGSGEGDGESVFHDTSGIMMYSPLIPTNDSLVEIADSGVITPPPLAEGESSSAAAQFAGLMGMWPFSIWSGGPGSTATMEPTGTASPAEASPVPSITPLSVSPPGSPRSAQLRIQGQQRVWVPSTTKLSFQAMWWGYRLYLPPPVLDILDQEQLEASKRAALITTALTWFFSHIPLDALPVAVRPAVLLLQTLIPFIGYIGTFISWSWSTIKSYDTGHGVILTATWLLPVALIPGTWEERDFPPASPPVQGPTPLPPTTDPTSPPISPSPTSPAPAQPSSPPASPVPLPALPPTPSQPRNSVQLHPQSPPQHSSPVQDQPHPFQMPTPPLTPQSSLPQASEPLPPWVPPPPPPSPPKIPLPDLGPDEPSFPPSPRFGFGVLGMGKSRDREKRKDKDKDREGERKKEKGKAKFRAIVSSPFMGSKSGT